MRRATRTAGAAIAGLVLLVGATSCGEDELSAGEWVDGADAICTDAAEQVNSIPLVTDVESVINDATARGEILTSVRDQLIALGRPDEVDDAALDNYLAQLEADIEVMATLKAAVRASEDYARLDASAGFAAADISLARCLAFSDAIVQLPY